MAKKDRKYIRDAKGRFAEVPDHAPAPAKFFSQFTPEEAGALLKQQKSDRAKARRAKAKLLAAGKTANDNLQSMHDDPNFKPFQGVTSPKKPVPEAPQGEKTSPVAPMPKVFPKMQQGSPVYAGNTKIAMGYTKPTKVYKVEGHYGTFKYKSDAINAAKDLQKKNQEKLDAEQAASKPAQPATPQVAEPVKVAAPSPDYSGAMKYLTNLQAKGEAPPPVTPQGQTALDKVQAAKAAKAARAKARREKAKLEAAKAGQNVTFADEQKPAAKKAAAPKAGPTEAEQKAQADLADATQRSTESATKLAQLRAEKKNLESGYGYVANKWKLISELNNKIQAETAKKKQADVDKAKARVKISSEKAKRSNKPAAPGAAEKAEFTAIDLEYKQNQADIKNLEAELQAYYNNNGNSSTPYWKDPAYKKTYDDLNNARAESTVLKKRQAEARSKLDRALGKVDTNSDVTDPSWTVQRKMNTSITVMNAQYEKDDPAWRNKLKKTTWDHNTVTNKATPKDNPDALPANRIKAHTDYTHSTYRLINNALRESKDGKVAKSAGEVGGGFGVNSGLIDNYWTPKGGLPKLIQELSGLINEDGHTTEEPVTVMRGIRGNASYHPGEIYQEGAIVEEKAFTSVTVSKKIQQSFAKPRGFKGDNSSWSMYIRLPAGTNYAHGNMVEREMILDKGTKFKVLKVDKEKNQIFLAKVD